VVDRVREQYRRLGPIPCTGCGYCLPCPNGVDIPYNLALCNEGVMFEREHPRRARFWYRWMAEGSEGEWFHRGQAPDCLQCRECEARYPQGLPIGERLVTVHQALGEGKPYPVATMRRSG
jgi:predicted aldo/keto reductase-like oxidoreductase